MRGAGPTPAAPGRVPAVMLLYRLQSPADRLSTPFDAVLLPATIFHFGLRMPSRAARPGPASCAARRPGGLPPAAPASEPWRHLAAVGAPRWAA